MQQLSSQSGKLDFFCDNNTIYRINYPNCYTRHLNWAQDLVTFCCYLSLLCYLQDLKRAWSSPLMEHRLHSYHQTNLSSHLKEVKCKMINENWTNYFVLMIVEYVFFLNVLNGCLKGTLEDTKLLRKVVWQGVWNYAWMHNCIIQLWAHYSKKDAQWHIILENFEKVM